MSASSLKIFRRSPELGPDELGIAQDVFYVESPFLLFEQPFDEHVGEGIGDDNYVTVVVSPGPVVLEEFVRNDPYRNCQEKVNGYIQGDNRERHAFYSHQ